MTLTFSSYRYVQYRSDITMYGLVGKLLQSTHRHNDVFLIAGLLVRESKVYRLSHNGGARARAVITLLAKIQRAESQSIHTERLLCSYSQSYSRKKQRNMRSYYFLRALLFLITLLPPRSSANSPDSSFSLITQQASAFNSLGFIFFALADNFSMPSAFGALSCSAVFTSGKPWLP